jgi:spore germination protein KC
MSQMMFLAKGKAMDILDVKPEFESMPATVLKKTLEDQRLTSEAPIVTMYDFLNNLIRTTKCPVLPIVVIVEDDGQQRLKVDGCAVFKADRMVGEFDELQTRGLLFIEDKVKAGVVT